MDKLKPSLGRMPPFDTRNWMEKRYALSTMTHPWSGYLGGIHRGGYWVERLSDEWKATFRTKFAIPCNSATSGLLGACIALGIGPGDEVWCPVYTMSATAACAKVLGATVKFIDIEPIRFSMNMNNFPGGNKPKAIIVTNLFGQGAFLQTMRSWCDTNGVTMIEDNAQAPFATVNGKYTGTIGHIGVFSLNVHKHIQAGEGGVVVTDDAERAAAIMDAVNHGELNNGRPGLNLRMTELIASVSVAQLSKGQRAVDSRRELAQEMTDMVKDIQGITPPIEDIGCHHVYYIWAAVADVEWELITFVRECRNRGVPINAGYSPLLTEVFQSNDLCPEAASIERRIMTFDICSHDPTTRQRRAMREIFKIAGDTI